MIVDGIITMALGFLNTLVGLLPDLSIQWGSASGFGELLTTANMFLPISELLALVRVLLGLGVGLAMVWAIYKIIDWLPIT